MKRYCLFRSAICLFCLMVASNSAAAEGFDFRDVRWGMNRFEVMASESGAPKRIKREEILYRISLFKRPAYLMYRFYEDRLVGARYVLPVKGADTLEKLGGLVSLRYGAGREGFTSAGATRVWMQPDRTISLSIPKKGQAVIDVVSSREEMIFEKEIALIRQIALETVANSL